MNERELLALKKEIETAKTQVAELKGTHKHLMKELKDDWECNSIKEAEDKLSKMEANLTKLQEDIETGIDELQEKYDLK